MSGSLKLIVVFVIFLLISPLIVFSKGGGSQAISIPKVTSCDDMANVDDRVKCKLEKNEEDISVNEACSVLEGGKKNDCVTLHKRVYSCYEKIGKDKDKCFKDKAKFTYNTVKNEVLISPTNVRNYLLFLLYNLEDIIEDAYKDNRISSIDGANLIAEIVKIKHGILIGKPSSEIKKLVVNFKDNWDRLMK